jgi:hypothetical protein
MNKQRSKAIEPLEITDDDHVKCQGCGSLWLIIKDNMMRSESGKIYHLQSREKRASEKNSIV